MFAQISAIQVTAKFVRTPPILVELSYSWTVESQLKGEEPYILIFLTFHFPY